MRGCYDRPARIIKRTAGTKIDPIPPARSLVCWFVRSFARSFVRFVRFARFARFARFVRSVRSFRSFVPFVPSSLTRSSIQTDSTDPSIHPSIHPSPQSTHVFKSSRAPLLPFTALGARVAALQKGHICRPCQPEAHPQAQPPFQWNG